MAVALLMPGMAMGDEWTRGDVYREGAYLVWRQGGVLITTSTQLLPQRTFAHPNQSRR